MPFGDDEVEISYRAVVTGMQDVEALRSQTADIQGQTTSYTSKVNEATVAHEKHKNALLQTHSAIRQLHRELFVGVGIFGLVTAGLSAMAKGSESAQIGFDQLTAGATKFFGNIGNWTARITAFWGAISAGASLSEANRIAEEQTNAAKSFDTRIKLLNMEANLYKTKGDELHALKSKQAAEDLALEKDKANKSYDIFKASLDKQHDAEMEAFRLHSMGMKQQSEIDSEFKKSIGGDFQNSTANVIDKFITGQKQTLGDIAKDFTGAFSKTISTAISQSLFTSMAQGGGFGGFLHNFMNILTGKKDDPAKETNRILSNQDKILQDIRECVCKTASATEAMAACGCPDNSKIPISASLTPGKESTWSKLATITGAIGSIAGGIGGIPGLGGLPGGVSNPVPQLPADIKLPLPSPFMIKGHSGMEIPQFPSGGEVPIMAQPGEFIIRKSAAQENKDLLKSVNSGARQSKQAQNIFFISANDAKSFSDMLSNPSSQAAMEMQITKAIMSNGSLRNAIRSFGRG